MLDDEYSDESVVSVADLAIGASAPVWIITMVQRSGVNKEWCSHLGTDRFKQGISSIITYIDLHFPSFNTKK